MSSTKNTPFNVSVVVILFGISLLLAILYLGQHILFPILLAILVSILLLPVVNFLHKRLRFKYALAVGVAVFLAIALLAGIVLFVSWQIGDIANDWNKIKANVATHYHNIQGWVEQRFNISYSEQNKYVRQATKQSLDNTTSSMGNRLSSLTDALLNLILIPIYTFLLLLYKDLFVTFLYKLTANDNIARLKDILSHIKIAIHSYLVGLLTEMAIVATLITTGYMIVGIQYALLLGVITGILNLIPYIGVTIAGLLSLVATLSGSTDVSIIFGVIIVNVIVQFLDNNLLVPLVVSSKVKINAFVSLVAIITGGAIAGVAGMFLAIPILAILKVIFDRTEALEPWGYVMGDHDTEPKRIKLRIPFIKKSKRSVASGEEK